MDECRFIEITLSRISAEIDSLLAEKSRLSQRLNTLRARTSVLPPETVATIFEHACQGYRDRYIFSSVCSHWHRIVQNTPSLFTSVSIHHTRSNAVNFLLHHHRHAKDLPLTVELDSGCRTSPQKMRPLVRVLFTEIPRNLKSLIFHSIEPVLWSLIQAYSTNDSAFPQLESLTLGFSFADAQQLEAKTTKLLFAGSRLSTLRLRFPVIGLEERLRLEDITLLEARGASSKQGMQFLIRCPNIAHFIWEVQRVWGESLWGDEAAIPMSTSPIILPFLETMTWKGDITRVTGLVRLLRVPSLHELEWEERPRNHTLSDDQDCRRLFFSSMSQLRTLHTVLNENIAASIHHLSTVEAAEIICPTGSSDTFLKLMHLLTWTAGICNLPRLKILTFTLPSVSKSELDMIINMLESRRKATSSHTSTPLEGFILRIKLHDITEAWGEHHNSRLKSLVEGGLKVIIWEDKYTPGRMLVL